ncbi:hypothetical protein DFH11DRAFT_991946 [Phellopilus nigrolimitatus]|nr:hypothetical protein DFH11DRAFT_991946 [Phellopilus nigrolimitatus]
MCIPVFMLSVSRQVVAVLCKSLPSVLRARPPFLHQSPFIPRNSPQSSNSLFPSALVLPWLPCELCYVYVQWLPHRQSEMHKCDEIDLIAGKANNYKSPFRWVVGAFPGHDS